MKATAKTIDPADYVLSVLSPEDRLEAAMNVSLEALKGSKLTVKDIENAVRTIRRRAHGKKP